MFENFENIFIENSNDVLYYLELPSGTCKYITKSSQTLFGYSPEDFYNNKISIKKIIHPQSKDYFLDAWNKLLVGEILSFYEYSIIDKNGDAKWINQRNYIDRDSKGNIIGLKSLISDVTKYKNTDTANLLTNLKEAQALSKIGHWELDLITNELYWSDEVYRIFGLKPQEFSATYEGFLQYIHPDDHDLVNNAYSKSLEDKSPYSIKHRVLTKNNDLKYVEERCIHKLDNAGKVIKSIGTVHDITLQVEHEKKLEIASNVFKYATNGILITDKDNLIVSANESFEKLTGYKLNDIIDKNPRLFSSGWGDKEFYKKMWDDLGKNDFWEDELWDRKKDGTTYAVHMSIVCVRDNDDNIMNYIAIAHDITESKNKENEIHKLAYYDFLTKIPNRKLFKQELESYIKSSHFNKKSFAVLFLDLDNFKWVNDSLGHHIGDKILVEVSKMLKSVISVDSIVARLGGDEFVIIAPFNKKLEISKLATNILNTLIKPITIDKSDINVSWSIGISIFPDNAQDYTDLLKNADIAMYQAKENGKNNFRYFNEVMNSEAVYRLNIDTKLRYAINNNLFTLNYQPKYSYKDNNINGVEALIRWTDSELGFVPPDKFIPIAEDSGYINEIGTWVMKQALSDLKIIHETTNNNLSMAINISGKQLNEKNFYQNTKQIIEQSGINPKYIEFEITETAIMEDIDSVTNLVAKIKDLGITISIDDFGTGYSSMSYLKKLPLDILKIDREFIMELESDEDSQSIVEAIIALGKALKLNIIAEGVETVEQKEILEKLECNLFQGYLYSKPLDLNRLKDFIIKEA